MNVGSLFSGIGGIDLGLERAGMHVAWQCELDSWCRSILARHWPDVPCYEDIRAVDADAPRVDVLAGGFPCPVVSSAARGRNVGPWLWPEYARCIRVLRPRFVVLENVAGLLRGHDRFGEVLGDLAELGYDATWRVLRASDFGAPHQRARLWLVGHAHGNAEPNGTLDAAASGMQELRGVVRQWPDPPRSLGVANGVPARVDRLRALGNAVVPACAEHIGRLVMEMDA